jgi:hypothetical protein
LPNSPLIASKMLTNFSFRCFDWNNTHMLPHKMETIVFSHFLGIFEFPHLEDVENHFLHIDLAYALFLIYLCCANCVVNKNGHVINDVLLYHAHTYFAWSLLCEGTRGFLSWFLSPLHHDGDLSSRTTLFQAGGDDAGRPTVVATSCIHSSAPTYAKSSWTSKVNSILDTSPFHSHENGILLHTPSYDIARFTSTSTETWEEARSLKSDIVGAWKRRRKKQRQRYYRCPASGTTATHRYYRLGNRHGRVTGHPGIQRANPGPAVATGTHSGTTAGPESPTRQDPESKTGPSGSRRYP